MNLSKLMLLGLVSASFVTALNIQKIKHKVFLFLLNEKKLHQGSPHLRQYLPNLKNVVEANSNLQMALMLERQNEYTDSFSAIDVFSTSFEELMICGLGVNTTLEDESQRYAGACGENRYKKWALNFAILDSPSLPNEPFEFKFDEFTQSLSIFKCMKKELQPRSAELCYLKIDSNRNAR